VSIAEASVPPPTATSRHATTPTDTPVQVSLTEGASGGPFTAADVVSTLPAGAGTSTVSPDGDGGYVLTFTPVLGFVGTATVRYTLSNASGPSDPGTVTIEVTALPDPIADVEVSGISQSQSAIAQVFAQSQVNNVVQRLDRLQEPRSQEWGFWFSGGMRRGDLDANGNAEGLAFETSGVTTGADRRFGESFAFGMAGGLGQDRTLIGSHGSRSDSQAHAAVGYGSFHPPKSPYFVNAMHGHQRLSFQLRRYAPGSGAAAAAARKGMQGLAATMSALDEDVASGDLLESPRTGGQDFSSLGGGYRHEGKVWTFTSYGRQDNVSTHLDAYDEPLGIPGALSFGEQDMSTRTSILGFRADGTKQVGWGTLLPKLKLELQRDASDQGVVSIRYLDQPDGPEYRSEPRGFDSSRLAVEIGATLVTKRFLTLRLEYHAMIGGIYHNDNSLIFSFEKEH
jgi:uncharacterized protein with beta-barrel porin domain